MYWIFVAVCLLLVAIGNPDLKRSLDEQLTESDQGGVEDADPTTPPAALVTQAIPTNQTKP